MLRFVASILSFLKNVFLLKMDFFIKYILITVSPSPIFPTSSQPPYAVNSIPYLSLSLENSQQARIFLKKGEGIQVTHTHKFKTPKNRNLNIQAKDQEDPPPKESPE